MVTIRKIPLVNGEIYHVYNRGVEKRMIVNVNKDYERFLESLDHYRFENVGRLSNFKDFGTIDERIKKDKLVEIISLCMMPNHFHLLLRQLKENGISVFMSNVLNSYTKYFNVKYDRIGPLFQGSFKSVHIENDEQLMHVSRYIHLNVIEVGLVSLENFAAYPWSSLGNRNIEGLCDLSSVTELFNNSMSEYLKFCSDYASYKYSKSGIAHKLLDE